LYLLIEQRTYCDGATRAYFSLVAFGKILLPEGRWILLGKDTAAAAEKSS
jgi:hypothetical protein